MLKEYVDMVGKKDLIKEAVVLRKMGLDFVDIAQLTEFRDYLRKSLGVFLDLSNKTDIGIIAKLIKASKTREIGYSDYKRTIDGMVG